MSPDNSTAFSEGPGRNQAEENSTDAQPAEANSTDEDVPDGNRPSGELPETNSLEISPPEPSPTPSVPDLGSTSPFVLSNFSRTKKPISYDPSAISDSPNGLPPGSIAVKSVNSLSRYPLTSESVAGSSMPPIFSGEEFDTWYEPTYRDREPPVVRPSGTSETELPAYRPDLGHRAQAPTYRSTVASENGPEYCFENSRCESSSVRDVIATGRYFGNVSALYLQAAFQGNTAISIQGPGLAQSIPFDFDYEIAPQFQFGFQSKNGGGLQFDCWQYDETSNVSNFTSDGTNAGTSSTWMLGPNRFSRLTALNAGEQLDTSHTIDVEVFGVSFFKEIKFNCSRLNGVFGFQYSSITQTMESNLSNGGGQIGSLRSRSDMNGWGPKFALEGFRPIGNTRLELFATVGGAVQFGHRDQFVANSTTGDFDRVGADEFVTTVDFLTGIQYQKMTAENRSYYARLGIDYQTWIGGGTVVDPQGDFGLRGFSFSVGYNR